MRILCDTDPHYCKYSSIIRSRGEKYSTRLENQIQSFNWVEKLSKELNCDLELCLGDFFDRDDAESEELTALNEIKWNDIPHGFLVGNHELGRGDRSFSSAHLFSLIPNVKIFDAPESFMVDTNTEICFLPYILETDRKPLDEYFPRTNHKRIILSHNDIAGIQMGMFISKTGFTIEEIENNCSLFLNGHLHNGTEITNKIITLGNLTGQNFSEDATKYSHRVCLIDTDTCTIEYYENPYAFNFYKIDLTEKKFDLNSVKTNAVVQVTVHDTDYNKIKEIIDNNKNIIESRILIKKENLTVEETTESTINELQGSDHLQMFQEFVLSNIGNNDVVLAELQKVIGG